MPRQIHLNVFMSLVGHHEAAWRHPLTDPSRIRDLDYFQDVARTAERGKLDSLFFADSPALGEHIEDNVSGQLEPTILLAGLATVTEHIGLIATASTTFNEPYNLARRFASLDHISNGRAGWNIVTTWNGSAPANFGLEGLPEHSGRYARAREFVEISKALWDSWEDDAVLNDRSAGVYLDRSKVHNIDYVGPSFKVRGPLNIPRSPQGYPVLVQAGSSEDGKDFAATYAEAIFTAQQELEVAAAFAKDVKTRAAQKGRDPEKIIILPGFSLIIGSTEAEAKQLENELFELTQVEHGLDHLSRRLDGFDLSGYDLDGPLPDEILNAGNKGIQGAQSRAGLIIDLAKKDNLTIRQILQNLAGARGHNVFTGTPEQVADEMERWFLGGAADGFNLMPPYMPGGLEDFVDQVVPELQRRGLFRTEYEGTTLRDNYGLSKPENQYTAARSLVS
jgi:N-acetyl-S-(2-succino)cysteine monooxygenase